ncbi:MAG: sulfite exporter TauE/SafE family protein [Deltaproteobacteria bacterium]|nr:sulfite exporter TauE/SafE family protein [Deltaproteobacteria bacterium]
MDPLGLAALLAAGLVAGFINTIAGGGSMLTLPALVLIGLPVDVANGTNRIAVVLQSLAGAWRFDKAGVVEWATVRKVLLPTIVGAVIGAVVAAYVVPQAYLGPVLFGTMLVVALVFLIRPPVDPDDESAEPHALSPLGLFVAGLYGGFVQAGVGLVLLAVLTGLTRRSLVEANALKLVVVLAFTLVALGVFVMAGQVRWVHGLVLSGATVVGALLGVRFALKARSKALRAVVFGCAVVACVAALFR